MSMVHFSIGVDGNGALKVPAFAVRGLGLSPGDKVSLALPVESPECIGGCDTGELILCQSCGDSLCTGYACTGEELNIPAALLSEAGIPLGSDVTLITCEGAVVLVACAGDFEDVDEEIAELLCDIGTDELNVRTLPVRCNF